MRFRVLVYSLGLTSVLFLALGQQALASAQLCERAAQQAAQRHNVPLDVMRAVALVETGRDMGQGVAPWPWALHTQGRGHWPATRDAALAQVRDVLRQGVRNIDLGCFQVNYHWHGHNFASLEEMIDPSQNADYAARLLRQHYQRFGDWVLAAGAYHSLTPALAERYRARIVQAMGRKPVRPQMASSEPVSTTETARDNSFALLQPADAGKNGSLVPQALMTGSGALIQIMGAP